MLKETTVTPRTIRLSAIATGDPSEAFRAQHEAVVPSCGRLEALGVVNSAVG